MVQVTREGNCFYGLGLTEAVTGSEAGPAVGYVSGSSLWGTSGPVLFLNRAWDRPGDAAHRKGGLLVLPLSPGDLHPRTPV